MYIIMNVTSINPQLVEAFYAEEIGPGMNILRQTQERQSLLRAMKASMREIGNKAFTMATGTRRSENEKVQHPPYEE
jgi:hypothetical protein